MKKIITAVATITTLGLLLFIVPAMAGNCDGAATCWKKVSSFYNALEANGGSARPTFVDIDGDGDQDLFVGYSFDQDEGNIHANNITFFQNTGVPGVPKWTLGTHTYIIDTGNNSTPTPTFVDIDADGDQDLFIGKADGTITFYRNIGTPNTAAWHRENLVYGDIDVGYRAVAPAFVDIDRDGDQDLFIGAGDLAVGDPAIYFYRNTGDYNEARWSGTPETPFPETPFEDKVWLKDNLSPLPAFRDIDGDGDQDLFIGSGSAAL